eukprot:9631390-Alexandrium_andersonii.AAC.1
MLGLQLAAWQGWAMRTCGAIFATGMPEIAHALRVTPGEALQIAKACNGLLSLPRSVSLESK